jgi:hypothetical protein
MPLLALGTFLACGGGSYSSPAPENGDGDVDIAVRVQDDADEAVVRANNASMDQVVDAAREVLQEEGWTVFRVDRSGTDRVIEARKGGNELLRIYATPKEGDVALRGWRQENGEPKGFPTDILQAIELRLRTGN